MTTDHSELKWRIRVRYHFVMSGVEMPFLLHWDGREMSASATPITLNSDEVRVHLDKAIKTVSYCHGLEVYQVDDQ